MSILLLLIELYTYVVFASIILSWVNLSEDNPLVLLVRQLTEPVLEPIRRVLPPAGGFDLSSLVLLIGLHLLRSVLGG